VAKYLFLFLINAFWATDAYAYLDPSAGSMLISSLLGVVATALFLFKSIQYKLKSVLSRGFGIRFTERKKYSIVFYSEGRQYWSTFKPVLQALDELQVNCTYLTSGEDDPGLSYRSKNIQTKFIGKGNRAYAILNVLEADVCVLTTPGLDVLQIKRSKGVRHYIHLMHSLSDIATYKRFSFDYYDTLLTSGEHQIRSIRELEKQRGTKEKNLLRSGCTNMDVLQAKVVEVGPMRNGDSICVLVAPTWGVNGLFSKFGASLPKMLLDAGYKVILRPHPQSYISEKKILESLEEGLSSYSNLKWDNGGDGFESMRKATVLVSDLSGIIFDFAFIFEKPVITIRFAFEKTGMEASDLPWEPWETTVLNKVGVQISEKEMDVLPQQIREIADNGKLLKSIKVEKEKTLFNPGKAGITAARQILSIQQDICE